MLGQDAEMWFHEKTPAACSSETGFVLAALVVAQSLGGL